MLGGDPEVIAACEPIISAYAAVMLRLGEVGAGQSAKLVNNTLMAANLMLAHEAVTLGARLGLDPEALQTVIKTSSGGSFAMNVYAQLPTLAAFARGGRLLRKDVGLLSALQVGSAQAPTLTTSAVNFLNLVDAASEAATNES